MGRVGECLVCDWTIIILCDYTMEILFIVSYDGYFDYYELMQCICTVIRDNLSLTIPIHRQCSSSYST